MEDTEMTIRRATYIRSMVLATALLALGASRPAVAKADGHCVKVGGGVLTNLIDPTDTLGTATGDLSGGLGITILQAPNPPGAGVYKVHHHWVTTTGDTLQFEDAYLTLYATGVNGVFLGEYNLPGILLIGGTGRYEHATGTLNVAFGAVDLNQGLLTLRYAGTVCLPSE
jgi:hypothetical protein